MGNEKIDLQTQLIDDIVSAFNEGFRLGVKHANNINRKENAK